MAKPSPAPVASVPECSPISVRTAPTSTIPLRQAVELMRLGISVGDPIEGQTPLALACVAVAFPRGVVASLALDLQFEQTWLFQAAFIADLHSTLALAPREEVSLEIRTTQRKSLTESVINQVEEIESTEATIVDKETVNVARASAQTSNWSVGGNGSFSLGPISLGATATVGGSASQTATSSVEQVHEATRKSAENLKTLHKIEVHGLSETLIEDRIARRIKNPYDDRTLTLNIFQLLKRYDVTTAHVGTRPALVFSIEQLVMDRQFVLTNGGFLRATLLDADLLDELVGALAVARRPPQRAHEPAARRVAHDALRYLFEVPNIFNAPDIGGVSNNDPSVSFDASVAGVVPFPPIPRSGLVDAVDNKAGVVFTTLNFFYRRYMDMSVAERQDHAIELALGLAHGTRSHWEALAADPDALENVLDLNGFTEGLRRLSGFLAMVDGMLRPQLEALEHEREAQAAAESADVVLDRVVAHLRCLRDYYIQRFLRYLAQATSGVALAGFVRDAISRLLIPAAARELFLTVFEARGAFVDRNEIVVPADHPIDPMTLVEAAGGSVEPETIEVEPVTDAIDVPFDGMHLEIAPGDCRLPDVPQRTELSLGELAVRDFHLGVAPQGPSGPPFGPGQ